MTSTRRRFLSLLAQGVPAAALLAGAPRTMARMWAMPRGGSDKILVFLNFEGAYDALSMVPPRGSTAPGSVVDRYLTMRPNLGWPTSGPGASLPLTGNSQHGLHPALAPLQAHWANGDLAIVQKVGLPGADLSHFRARDTMSKGRASAAHPDPRGWLGRLSDAGLSEALDIVGVGIDNRLDFNATGTNPIVVRGLVNFNHSVYMTGTDSAYRRDVLRRLLEQASPADSRIVAAARTPLSRGNELAASLTAATSGIQLNGNYPTTTTDLFSSALQDIAKIIGAGYGTRVFYTSSGGFDTHGGQEVPGAGSKPTLTARLGETMQALNAFITDLKSPAINRWNDVAIVVFTEFGRRNYENNTGGTDHGHAFHAFVLGGAVQGGIKGLPLTLADLNTMSGNLPVQIDFRTVFRRSLSDWLLLPTATVNNVFDDYTPSPSEPSFTLF